MLKKKFPGIILLLILPFVACETSKNPKFAVAANLLYPMQEIQEAYTASTGKSFDLISGSSGVISAQITNGAPFDLFFSANIKYPQTLFEAGFSAQPPLIIIKGQSVFWSKYPIEVQGIDTLLRSGQVNKFAIANPELAPYGAQAKNWLKNLELWKTWEEKLVLGENIGQVNQYIHLESVDAAVTAISAKYAKQLQGKGYWKMLKNSEVNGIPHGLIVLPHAPKAAQEIVDFLQTAQAQEIFLKYGYSSP